MQKKLQERNQYKEVIEVEKEQKKCIKMESQDDLLVDCTLQWLNMLSKSQQEKVVDNILKLKQVKKEPEPPQEEKEPFVPPPDMYRKEKSEEKIKEEEEEERKMKTAVEAADKATGDGEMDTTEDDSTKVETKEEKATASSSKEGEAERIFYEGVDVTECDALQF